MASFAMKEPTSLISKTPYQILGNNSDMSFKLIGLKNSTTTLLSSHSELSLQISPLTIAMSSKLEGVSGSSQLDEPDQSELNRLNWFRLVRVIGYDPIRTY